MNLAIEILLRRNFFLQKKSQIARFQVVAAFLVDFMVNSGYTERDSKISNFT